MPQSSSRRSTEARRARPTPRSRSRSSRRPRSPIWRRRRAPSGWPAPTWPATWTSWVTCTRRWPGWPARSELETRLSEKLRLVRELGGAKVLLPRVPPPPQEVRVNRRWLGRPAALQAAGRDRDLAPLRRVQHVLRVGARPVDGLHLRLLPGGGRDPRAGPVQQVRPGRAQARPAAGDAAAGRRLRLGRHGDARRARVRRAGARRDPVGRAGRLGAARDQGGGPVRPGRGTAPGLPGRHRDGLRRGQLHRPDRAHRQGAAGRTTSRSCTAS